MLSSLDVCVDVHGQIERSNEWSVMAQAMLLYEMYGSMSVLYRVNSMCFGRVLRSFRRIPMFLEI